MESLFHGNMEVIMRSRLRANVRDMDSEELIQAPQLALNEVTIDRGPSHYICNLGKKLDKSSWNLAPVNFADIISVQKRTRYKYIACC